MARRNGIKNSDVAHQHDAHPQINGVHERHYYLSLQRIASKTPHGPFHDVYVENQPFSVNQKAELGEPQGFRRGGCP